MMADEHDEVVATLLARIASLEERLTALEGAPDPTPAPISALVSAGADGTAGAAETADAVAAPASVDRRAMLGSVGRVAAGALAGGAAAAVALPASPAAAVPGTFTGNPAVTATADPGGVAVLATSQSAGATIDGNNNGTGAVLGFAGILGRSGAGYGGQFRGGAADLRLGSSGAANLGGPASRSTAAGHALGELVLDTNTGDLWLSAEVAAIGSTGRWRKLGGPGAVGTLHLLAATRRVYDSRAGFAPLGVQKGIFVDATRTISATAASSGVPTGASTGARAVLVNLAVTNTNSGGFAALFPAGIGWPGNASINWGLPNTSISNSAVVGVDTAGQFLCKVQGTADVIVDVVGYYQ